MARLAVKAGGCATLLLAALLAGCVRQDGPAPVVHAGTQPRPPGGKNTGRPGVGGERPNTVIVQKGETLFSIARRFDVPIRTLIEANKLPPPYHLTGGQSLIVPQIRQYIVQPGESLKTVARKFGVDASTLAATNKLAPPYGLKSGQALILPAAVQTVPQAGKPPVMASAAAPPSPPQTSPQTGKPVPPPPAQTASPPLPLAPPSRPEQQNPTEAKDTKDSKDSKEKKPAMAANPSKPLVAPPPPPAAGAAHVLTPPSDEPQIALATPPKEPVAPPAAAKPPAAQSPASPPPKEAEEPEESSEPAPAPHSAAGFQWPVRGPVLTGFGLAPSGTQNDGINLAAALGAPILAANDGEVAYIGNELRGYGNLILLKHADGWMTAYAHCESLTVKVHDHIKRGQPIGRVGKTGAVAEPQLHFEIRRGSRALDPANYLPSLSAAR